MKNYLTYHGMDLITTSKSFLNACICNTIFTFNDEAYSIFNSIFTGIEEASLSVTPRFAHEY
jgi:hypothetical protein